MLVRKWAWEALLASDETKPETVEQIAAELADLRNPEVTQLPDPQPALEARHYLYWIRQAAARRQPIGEQPLEAMHKLACLVADHDSGLCTMDEDYNVVSELTPDAGLAARLGYHLVLKKLLQQAYDGADDHESPSEAFARHCHMWDQSAIGQKIKEEFDRLMVENTPSHRHLLPGLASAQMRSPLAAEAQLLADLGQLVSRAEGALSEVFLERLAAHAAEDDVRGHSILEQLRERPHKRRRLGGAAGGQPQTPPLGLAGDEGTMASPAAIGQAIAAYTRAIGSQGRPAPVGGASAERLSRRVREREEFVDRSLYPNENIAPDRSGAAATPPTGARQGRPAGAAGGAPTEAEAAGPPRPQEGRVVPWGDSPSDVADPRDTPPRRPRRPTEYPSPRGTRGRRPTVRWDPEEAEHLMRLVAEFGAGNWSNMIAEGVREGDTIKRRNQVDLKDKWRNMCKADPSLKRLGPDEVARRGDAAAPAEAANAGANADADDGGAGDAAAGDADGGGDTEPAANAEGDDAATDDAAEGGAADAGGAAEGDEPAAEGSGGAAAATESAVASE